MCSGDEMECLWTCTDKNDTLVAFATGTYRASSNKFFDVHVYVTQYGATTYQISGSQATVFDDFEDPAPDVMTGEPGDVTAPGSQTDNPPAQTQNPTTSDNSNANAGSSSGEDNWASQMEQQFKESDAYKEQLKKQEGGS